MEARNRYSQIIERIFLSHYQEGAIEVPFAREEIVQVALELGIPTPKNLGDVVYSFRYRNELPQVILDRTPEGRALADAEIEATSGYSGSTRPVPGL